MVSITENHGSIFHFDSIISGAEGGGGGAPLLLLFSLGPGPQQIMDPCSISNPLSSRVRLGKSII